LEVVAIYDPIQRSQDRVVLITHHQSPPSAAPTAHLFKAVIREVKICIQKFTQAYSEFGPKKPSSTKI
jgi:hypothetical protein